MFLEEASLNGSRTSLLKSLGTIQSMNETSIAVTLM